MPTKKDLSPEEIQEIVSLRGVKPADSIRKRFGIGTSRLYKIWKKAEKNRAAKAAKAAEATEAAKAKEVEEAAEAAEEDRGIALVLSAVQLLQEKMDLLLEGQEIHFEDVEDLEEKLDEAQKGILDNIEEGSNALQTGLFLRSMPQRLPSIASSRLFVSLAGLVLLFGGFLVLPGIQRHRSLQEEILHVFSQQRKRSRRSRRSQWCRTNQRGNSKNLAKGLERDKLWHSKYGLAIENMADGIYGGPTWKPSTIQIRRLSA